jgi:hypothetical protein
MTLFAVAVPVALTAGTVGSLTTFVNGTVTDANEINANFEAIRVAVSRPSAWPSTTTPRRSPRCPAAPAAPRVA